MAGSALLGSAVLARQPENRNVRLGFIEQCSFFSQEIETAHLVLMGYVHPQHGNWNCRFDFIW